MSENKKFIAIYIKEHRKPIIVFFLFSLIFLLVFRLYGLNMKLAIYPSILCAAIGTVFILFDFYHEIKSHKIRKDIVNHVDITLDNLPIANSVLEDDYQELLFRLNEEKNKALEEKIRQYNDIREYITLWAHQIKTPITAMGLLLQGLGGIESSKLKSQLFEIEQYVDISLQYMRFDSLNDDLVLQEYRIEDIVKQAIKYYSKTFITKRLTLNFTETDVIVVTDRKWLLFVIKQILSNSLKYTKEGSITIYMDKNKLKTLVIEDTGIGIEPNDIPRLFERGFTGYNGRKDMKATGIGLYLSKQILEKLNHNISITSKPGVGTRVQIDLSNLSKM